MDRYKYSVTPYSPIKDLIPGQSIRTPFTADLDKDEVFLCMKHGPVYRLFPGKEPIKVTGSNFESLHVRLFEEVKNEEPVKVETPVVKPEPTPVVEEVVPEPEPEVVPEETEEEVIVETPAPEEEPQYEEPEVVEEYEDTQEEESEEEPEEENTEDESSEVVEAPAPKYNLQYKPNYSKKKNRNKNHNH